MQFRQESDSKKIKEFLVNDKSFTEELRPCVICQKSEIDLVCTNCDKLTCHNF